MKPPGTGRSPDPWQLTMLTDERERHLHWETHLESPLSSAGYADLAFLRQVPSAAVASAGTPWVAKAGLLLPVVSGLMNIYASHRAQELAPWTSIAA